MCMHVSLLTLPLIKQNHNHVSIVQSVVYLYCTITSLPVGVGETKEMREKMGIMVHYNVKIRCVVAFGK